MPTSKPQQKQHSDVFLRIMKRRRQRKIKKIILFVLISGILAAGAGAVIVSQAQDGTEPAKTCAESVENVTKPAENVSKLHKSVAFLPEIVPVLEEVSPNTEPETETLIHSKDWDGDEAYLLAKIAMAEAEGEDTKGKALVILTVLNRVWSDVPYFPDTIEEVIFQEGAFAPIGNGRWNRVEPNADCFEALRMVEEGWDESQGALYFERTPDGETWHTKHLQKLFVHGNHTFYKER